MIIDSLAVHWYSRLVSFRWYPYRGTEILFSNEFTFNEHSFHNQLKMNVHTHIVSPVNRWMTHAHDSDFATLIRLYHQIVLNHNDKQRMTLSKVSKHPLEHFRTSDGVFQSRL